ncbi:PREDICTED: uncharacterized protein LOC108661606 [Theobroma cacao]|uniref:Uncharacterized protein LOC108661606 n=1 Tax=Theobroma cacao TaxID=3641 RepID=A0AB32W714_THECC|nr:PREDICTED: uncharacterized protein LOC108661606 [Theobroma cacao]
MDSHVDNAAATVPNAASVPTATITVNGSPIAPTLMTIPPLPSASHAKPFPDISKIEIFDGRNFKRWQERIFSILDVHGVVFALIDSKPDDIKMLEPWMYANKACRHTIISTLFNKLFDVYNSYKKVKQIWESMIAKYTTEDVGKQKFVIGNFYRWKMTDDKDIKNTIRREIKASKAQEIATKVNLVQGKTQRQQRYPYKLDHKPKAPHPTFKKKGSCFVYGKPGHHAAQYRKRAKENDKPANPRVNLVKADESNDVIAVVISQENMVASVKELVVDLSATRHICANRNAFTFYTPIGEGEETIYLGDSQTAQVFGKGKVLLNLTSGKTLTLNYVLHVPNIRANLVSVALLGKVGVKASFKSDKIVMAKNNVFVGKGYCNQGLFVLNISNVLNENDNSFTYMIDSVDL